MEEMVSLICTQCGGSFTRSKYEYQRNLKRNKGVFCNHHCYVIFRNKKYPTPKGKKPTWMNPGNRLDEFSPFKMYIRLINQHTKRTKKEVSITLQDLKNQWDKQKGICPYTGWKMNISPTSKWDKKIKDMNQASVDRIDSSRGYILGNIQFVCMIANFAKNSFSDKDLIEFCTAVYKNMVKSHSSA